MGVVSPVGNDCGTFFDSLLAGRSGIRRLSASFVDRLTANVGGEVDYDPATRFSKAKLGLLDRFSQFALEASAQAIQDSGLEFDEALKARTGVFVGTGLGGARTIESGYEEIFLQNKNRVAPYIVPRAMNNAAAGHISIDYGLRGPNVTYSTACSSSAVAIGEACRTIPHGDPDAPIARAPRARL